MPRTCRLFSKVLLASIGARWEMDKLYCNAEEVKQKRFRRILAASSEHHMKVPDCSPIMEDSELQFSSADDFDVIDHKINLDCRKRNPLLRDFELSVMDACEPVELSLEGHFNFHLILRRIAPNSSPFAADLVVVEDNVPVEIHPHHFLYEGHVEGDPQSRVFGSLLGDSFDGHIHLSDGNSFTAERITKLRKMSSISDTSDTIITRGTLSPEEMKKFEEEEEMREEERFKHSEDEEENEEIEKKEMEMGEKNKKGKEEQRKNSEIMKNEKGEEDNEQAEKRDNEKEIEEENKKKWEESIAALQLLLLGDYYKQRKYNNQVKNEKAKICTMHLKVDHALYNQILTNEGNNDPTRAREEIVGMLYTLMQAVNDIYDLTRFYGTRGIQFVIKRISIETKENESSSGILLDTDNFEERDGYHARQSQNDHSEFCLLYIFTYKTFTSPSGTNPIGFTLKALPYFGFSDGVCGPFRPFNSLGEWVNRSYNTGVVTLRNASGTRLGARLVQLVMAHELGHSLGARHDEMAPPEEAFLMNPARATLLPFEYPNMSKFSPQRIHDMSAVLDALESYELYDPEGKRDYGIKRNCLRCEQCVSFKKKTLLSRILCRKS